MNFNDKFLNVCFKLGKVLFSCLLLLALIISLTMWVKTGISYSKVNNTKVKFDYNVSSIVNDMYAQDLGIQSKAKDNIKKEESKEKQKAFEIYNKFIDDNKLPAKYKENVDLPMDDEDKVAYMKGFVKYYSKFKKEFIDMLVKEKGVEKEKAESVLESNKENLFLDARQSYLRAYDLEKQSVNIEKAQLKLEQQSKLTASLISLAIFVLFLFLPILIRIEENTRK